MSDSLKSKASVLWKAIINSNNPFIELRKHAEEIDEEFLDFATAEVTRRPIGILVKLVNLAKEIADELNHARHIVNAANSYSHANEHEKALTGYKQAIQIFEKWDCSTEISRCVMNIGVVYIRKGDHDTALKCLERVKKDFESKGLDVEAMRCEVNVAYIQRERQEYKEAMETFMKAREFFHSRNLKHESMSCESNIHLLLELLASKGKDDIELNLLGHTKITTGPMDRRSLEIYQSREQKEIDKFLEDVKKGKFRSDDKYPHESRLKLNEPYTYNIPSTPIWPLISLYGTTIIKLYPIKEKRKFEKYHGFEVEDIPRLIQFAQSSQKVQFTLADAPTKFEGIHFLEQVFGELEPPATAFVLLDINESDIDGFLSSCHQSGFPEFCREFFRKEMGLEEDLLDMARVYAQLRYIGFHDPADRIQFCITNQQYEEALVLIALVRTFLIRPYVDPLKPTFSQLREMAQYGEMLLGELAPELAKKAEFPYEVGVFLNDKLKLIIPKNVDGAIELSDKYELLDLRKVMKGLDDNIKRGKAKSVIEGSYEISEIFEEVWHGTDKLKRKEQRIERYGISLGIAAIGSIIGSSLLGGLPGLLAGLGFGVTVHRLQVSKAISKKVMKWTTQSHMMHLYDFKEKYRLFD